MSSVFQSVLTVDPLASELQRYVDMKDWVNLRDHQSESSYVHLGGCSGSEASHPR